MKEKIVQNQSEQHLKKTKTVVLTGLLFSIAIVLSIIENSFPPILTAVPGVKLGLSNIAVMYALFFLNKGQAFSIAILKGLFVMFTRGPIAGSLSLCGGVVSLIVMIGIIWIFKEKASYFVISIFGSIFHNMGQLALVAFMFGGIYILGYFPVLLISGIIAGFATSTLLRFILPAFKKLGLK